MQLLCFRHFRLISVLLLLRANKSYTVNHEDIDDLIRVGSDVLKAIGSLNRNVDKNVTKATHEVTPFLLDTQQQIVSGFDEVNKRIADSVHKYEESMLIATQGIRMFLNDNSTFSLRSKELEDTTRRINSMYREMERVVLYQSKFENATILSFAEWVVSPSSESVPFLMESLHLKLFGSPDKPTAEGQLNFVQQLVRRFEESSDQICYTQQSAQQFIYSLYADIALTELKGYTMMEFSWMMLRIYGKGNFTQEAELMRRDYEKRTERTLKMLRTIMSRANRVLWRCDPSKYEKGTTYDEVTRLLQGYIENEVDMNTDETCRETCDFYQSARSEGCFKDLYCARQPKCSGKLYECTYVDADMWVCPSRPDSNRRYEYIEYESGRTLGQRQHCTRGVTKVESWWRWLFWRCSYCFCLCDEISLKSDRYFNLRETVSDVQNNKVITGLRFVKYNRIFHIQIQEGSLLPRGGINTSDLSWLPVDQYKIFDRTVRNGVDYHTLSYESRSVDLDDILTDDQSYVVTGVRFRKFGAHLNLEARFTEFDFETGTVIDHERTSFWKSNDNTDVSGDKRQKINLNKPDVPTRSILKSVPLSRHNQYIDFVNSNMDKDASQTTVPFVDIQDVVSNPPVPLAGIGIYHKGQNGYGGFLAPKIITYDFSPHVQIPTTISK